MMAMRPSKTSKLSIAPFNFPAKQDKDYAQRTWNTLRDALYQIFARNTGSLSFEELYRYAYNLVLCNQGAMLYDGLQQTLSSYLQTMAARLHGANEAELLDALRTEWHWFRIAMTHVRDILMYMDRAYVALAKKMPVYELGVSLFRDIVVRDPVIGARMTSTFVALVTASRSRYSYHTGGADMACDELDWALLRSVTGILLDMGDDAVGRSVYETDLERALLEATAEFYAAESRALVSEMTCAEFLRHVEQRIQSECRIAERCLDMGSSVPKLIAVVEDQLLARQMAVLVEKESGLSHLLQIDALEDLRRMYLLFHKVAGGDAIIQQGLRKEIVAQGTRLISAEEQNPNASPSPAAAAAGASAAGSSKTASRAHSKSSGEGAAATLAPHDPLAFIERVLEMKKKYDRIAATSFAIIPEVGMMMIGSGGGGSGSVAASSRTILEADAAAAVAAVYESSSAAFGTALTATNTTPDKRYVNVIHEAFEQFFNAFDRSAEYLSLYVDRALRQDAKAAGGGETAGITSGAHQADDENSTDVVLNRCIVLFRFLQDKDVFAKYCQMHLCKRLLSSSKFAEESERAFVLKLKNECGYLYTSKMESMFSDIKLSADTNAAFRESIREDGAGGRHGHGPGQQQGTGSASGMPIELSVQILTTGSWPIQPVSDGNSGGGGGFSSGSRAGSGPGSGAGSGAPAPAPTLPASVRIALDRFEQFYVARQEGRKLTWIWHLGTVEMRGLFGGCSVRGPVSSGAANAGGGSGGETGPRKYELTVSPYSMCVLMLFNSRDAMTYREILELSGVPAAELKRTLQSLSLAKYRVLTKEPRAKDVQPTDVFSFNDAFWNKSVRVRIQTVVAEKENDEEKQETSGKIEADRKPQIEAAVVRVMKARRTMEHNHLVIEVTELVRARFTPTPQDIKKRIESLIDREFLARDADDQRLYRYIA